MKKILTFLLALFLVMGFMETKALAADREMRGAWITTVYNKDWPSIKNNPEKQKEEFITILDKLQDLGINTVIVQVRPKGDALYPSSINPWSEVLTGTQGKDPGYDPLAFMISETHKRGMEFHAWFNPYRITTSGTDTSKLSSNHPAVKNPNLILKNSEALYYNPGLPEVRKHIVDTVKEVVTKYDVDAIHFDDYFYKVAEKDDDTYENSKSTLSEADWRRENINLMVQEVKAAIKSIKPSVEFGISPRGIYKNSESGTSGAESYSQDYADSVKWIKSNWIDYITPQLYWRFDNSAAPYGKLVDWWSQQVKGTDVKLYIGQGVYKDGSGSNSENVVAEIEKQIKYNRNNSEVKGSMYYTTDNLMNNSTLQASLKRLNALQHTKLIGNTRYETSVEVSKNGWSKADTVLLVNGYANADGLTASPLAAAYNAPILLTEQGKLSEGAKAEIKRLNPSKVILIGGTTVLSDNLISQVKGVNSNISVERLGGLTRYETSLYIAKRLDTIIDVSKAYVCYGYGEADALSISAKAGTEKAPIILAEKNKVPASTLSWLKGEALQTAHFIGGETVLYSNVISEINKITTKNVSGNRVAGANRFDTNAAVMNKFYPETVQPAFIAAKGLVLADALTAGPFGAKLNSPIVLISSELTGNQRAILNAKSSSYLYEIGGGINASAIEDLKNRIK